MMIPFIGLIMLSFVSCLLEDSPIRELRVINESGQNMYLFLDTTNLDTLSDEIFLIFRLPNKDTTSFWVDTIQLQQHLDKTKYTLFLFPERIINNYGWNAIRKDLLYEKYVFTEDSLRSINWVYRIK